MSYDYETPRRQRSTRQDPYYRDDRYSDAQDPYLRVQPARDLVPRTREEVDLTVEEVHRDFPPPGYARGDIRRARSAEPYDYEDDARSFYTRRSRDDYYDYDRRPRRKAESVYIEEEERKRKRMLGQQEKIIAAIAGAAVVLGGKEMYDRREAEQEGTDVHRNLISSAALGAAGALAAYQGAEFYNKRAEKGEKKSTHVVHKGRDGRVTEYYSDDEDEKQKKGHKNFLEAALGAAGLGTALKALTGGGGHDDRHHDRDRDERSTTRSRRGSRDESPGRGGPGSKMQKAAMASLIAGATEAFRVSKEPGGWKGEKAKRVLTAAAGAATIDAAQKPGKDGSKLGLAEAVIGGLIGNRMINGSKRDIIEDKKTGRSRSRSRAKSESGGGGGGMGLAALATAGLGALGAKKAVDNIRDERSRSRTRSRTRRRDDSVDSYDSRDESPRRRGGSRSRSRSVVDKARRGLARIGLGKGEDESEISEPRGSRRGGRYDDDYDSRDSRYRDDYDDDRSYRAASRTRGAPPRSRASSRGSLSSSDLGDSDEDEKRAKKMRGKQLITTGLAAVATIHAAHNVYQSMEKRNARHKAVKEGRLSPEEAKKLKSKALLQDAASVGIAAMGIKGAISELKEARELSHEVTEWQHEKEERHKRRAERLARLSREQQKKLHYQSDDDYRGDDSDDEATQYSRRSRADRPGASSGSRRPSRYDDGPRYSDGNPYAALPAPPVDYDDRR
ncbi:hypothetical protein VP1G_01368 [Cytospora mali]|uniref:DUF3824 domain-containing protein n=1 Tax=Cytospora mali TaxID=578113 RepID=A0A194UQZ2_CYTMA|nr:hypothetical protein VP1G_01368 [Valsa mali var. pyri (nom. inval.)]